MRTTVQPPIPYPPANSWHRAATEAKPLAPHNKHRATWAPVFRPSHVRSRAITCESRAVTCGHVRVKDRSRAIIGRRAPAPRHQHLATPVSGDAAVEFRRSRDRRGAENTRPSRPRRPRRRAGCVRWLAAVELGRERVEAGAGAGAAVVASHVSTQGGRGRDWEGRGGRTPIRSLRGQSTKTGLVCRQRERSTSSELAPRETGG